MIASEVLHGVYKNASTFHIDMLDFRGVFGSANNATCILRRGFCTFIMYIHYVYSSYDMHTERSECTVFSGV